MKTLFSLLCGLTLAAAAFGQTQITINGPVPTLSTTPPPGFTSVPFGNSSQFVPTLATVEQNVVTMSESQSILSLVNQGEVNSGAVVANLVQWASSYCSEQPLAQGCESPANMAAITNQYVTQLQAAFALVPASQWSPLTFTATGQYVNAIGYVNAAAAAPVATAPVIPTLIVGSCITVNGINGPSGTECGGAPGVTVAQVQAIAAPFIAAGITPTVFQNGVLYTITIAHGLMGISYFFSPAN